MSSGVPSNTLAANPHALPRHLHAGRDDIIFFFVVVLSAFLHDNLGMVGKVVVLP